MNVNLSNHRRIQRLHTLARQLEKTSGAAETLSTFLCGLDEAYGPNPFFGVSTRGLPPGHYRLVHVSVPASATSSGHPVEVDDVEPLDIHSNGGPISEIVRQTGPQLVHSADWNVLPQLAEHLHGFTSIMAVPVFSQYMDMDWAIALRPAAVDNLERDMEDFVLRCTLMGSLLESRILADRLAQANMRIEAQVRQLAEVQRALLPNPIPTVPGLDIAVMYEPSEKAGGDMYEVCQLLQDEQAGNDRWCIFVGDAAGHGPAAAAIMAVVQTLLRSCTAPVRGPSDLLGHLNYHLCRQGITGSFVTAFLGLFECQSRTLTYSSAGHPLPLLRSPLDTLPKPIDEAADLPLGIDPTVVYPEARIRLSAGQTLVIYTDGISEARAPDDTFFGDDGLCAALQECTSNASATLLGLNQALARHQGGHSATDDQTIVIVTVGATRV